VSHGLAAGLRERIDRLYRSESRRVLATLIRLLGDFDLAEEALQDAFMAAMEQWPRDGIPASPRAWLISTGRFKAIDRLRRRARFDAMLGELAARLDDRAAPDPAEQDDHILEDDRLRLVFSCRALQLTRQEPERRFIERRLGELARGPAGPLPPGR